MSGQGCGVRGAGVRRCEVRRCEVRRCEVRRCEVRRCEVWRCEVRRWFGVGALVVVLSVSAGAQGRQGGAAPPAGPPPTAQASAPIDLTGTWVSIVNEDWRWRMVTPPKGDYASVPLNAAARAVADAWDPAQDGRCEAYGAAAVMRMPGRLRITWDSPSVLKIETDAGQQTRLLRFDAAPAAGARTRQGHSVAVWERPGGGGRGGRAGGAPPAGGSLKVVTTRMRGGWLRRNGVPYSEDAVLTEHFDRFSAPNGDEWLVVTSIVSDPTYLTADFVTSTHFRREADASAFAPTPCR